jgi:hypothetical protein
MTNDIDPLEDFDEDKKREHARDLFILYREDFRWILSTASGRRVIRSLLEMTRADQEVFTSNGSTTNYAEGRRSIGVWIRNFIRENLPESWIVMDREELEEKSNLKKHKE